MPAHETNLVNLDLRFRTPGTILLCGPTASGKTTFVREFLLLRKYIYDREPGPVYYFYRVYQDIFDDMLKNGIVDEFHEGMVTMDWIKENVTESNCTIVIDDLASEVTQDTANLFTIGSHHYDFNIMMLAQNIFSKANPYFRDISINATASVIFKFPRDNSMIVNLAKQLAPGRSKDIVKIYKEATKRPYSHLYFDYHQATDEDLRIRSNIFAEHGEPMGIHRLN